MPMLASLTDARHYFERLPAQLEVYFDDSYQRAFDRLINAFEHFFDVAETINQQANDDHLITTSEATEIGEHGFTLILQMIDLMEKLDLPHKRREIEQISLIFARWVIKFQGQLNHIEPVVNAFAHSANSMQERQSLIALVELMSMVVDACSDDIKHDLQTTDLYRPWRLLLINRCIVATRTHDIELMRKVFDEFIFFLPQDAEGFFSEGMQEMDNLEFPPEVQKVIEQYSLQQPKIRIH